MEQWKPGHSDHPSASPGSPGQICGELLLRVPLSARKCGFQRHHGREIWWVTKLEIKLTTWILRWIIRPEKTFQADIKISTIDITDGTGSFRPFLDHQSAKLWKISRASQVMSFNVSGKHHGLKNSIVLWSCPYELKKQLRPSHWQPLFKHDGSFYGGPWKKDLLKPQPTGKLFAGD